MRGDKDSTPPHLNPLPLLGARKNELKTVKLNFKYLWLVFRALDVGFLKNHTEGERLWRRLLNTYYSASPV